jgi:LSD1 subclass zinc finger protein
MSAMWRDHRLFDRLVADVPVPIRVLSPAFSMAAYHQRNAAMVDDAREGIAFWTGRTSGGTYACLRYALAVPRGATEVRCPTVNALQSFTPITRALLRPGGVPA